MNVELVPEIGAEAAFAKNGKVYTEDVYMLKKPEDHTKLGFECDLIPWYKNFFEKGGEVDRIDRWAFGRSLQFNFDGNTTLYWHSGTTMKASVWKHKSEQDYVGKGYDLPGICVHRNGAGQLIWCIDVVEDLNASKGMIHILRNPDLKKVWCNVVLCDARGILRLGTPTTSAKILGRYLRFRLLTPENDKFCAKHDIARLLLPVVPMRLLEMMCKRRLKDSAKKENKTKSCLPAGDPAGPAAPSSKSSNAKKTKKVICGTLDDSEIDETDDSMEGKPRSKSSYQCKDDDYKDDSEDDENDDEDDDEYLLGEETSDSDDEIERKDDPKTKKRARGAPSLSSSKQNKTALPVATSSWWECNDTYADNPLTSKFTTAVIQWTQRHPSEATTLNMEAIPRFTPAVHWVRQFAKEMGPTLSKEDTDAARAFCDRLEKFSFKSMCEEIARHDKRVKQLVAMNRSLRPETQEDRVFALFNRFYFLLEHFINVDDGANADGMSKTKEVKKDERYKTSAVPLVKNIASYIRLHGSQTITSMAREASVQPGAWRRPGDSTIRGIKKQRALAALKEGVPVKETHVEIRALMLNKEDLWAILEKNHIIAARLFEFVDRVWGL